MKSNDTFEEGYEAIAFYARHWELLDWLDVHWGDNNEDVIAAAKKAKFSPDVVKRIQALIQGENANDLSEVILESAPRQAAHLNAAALKKIRDALREAFEVNEYTCAEDKPLTKRSKGWERELGIHPKRGKDLRTLLTVGASIEALPILDSPSPEKTGAKHCLITWFWLKGRAGSRLRCLGEPYEALAASLEQRWPDMVVVGIAPILPQADEEFRLNVDALIEECVAPMRKITGKYLSQLYEAAQ